jgi:hypothetical protein
VHEIVLDWSSEGAGAVSEDIGNLIADSLIDPGLLPEIDQAATGAYLTGLRAGGWRGRDIRVRRAIAATGAAKFCWLAADAPAAGRRPRPPLLRPARHRAGRAGRVGMLRLVADWGRRALTSHRPSHRVRG